MEFMNKWIDLYDKKREVLEVVEMQQENLVLTFPWSNWIKIRR